MNPLLSIIIPTKNRQNTAIFAVRSVLNIQSDKIEVVVQDCSDNCSLEHILEKEFPLDKRIKYYYSGSNAISLTQNWNLALANANGKYIVGIGDDDAILSYCIEVVEWMDSCNYDAVLGPIITYIWKDAFLGSFSNSRLTHSTNYSGSILKVDLQKEFIKKSLLCGFGYTEGLPNIYHGIVKRSLFQEHKKICGNYLDGTSFDVYNSIILPAYVKTFYYIDYPLTIRGVSGKSNANRIVSKRFDAHFNEFNQLNIPDILPRLLNAEVSIGESTIVALKDINRLDLIKKINFAIVFGKCSALNISKAYSLYKQFALIKNQYNTNWHLINYFLIFTKERIKAYFYNIILKLIFKLIPNSNKFIEIITVRKKIICIDILDAITFLKIYLDKNGLKINYNDIKSYHTKKEIWD